MQSINLQTQKQNFINQQNHTRKNPNEVGTAAPSRRDTASVSPQATNMQQMMSNYNSLTHINNKEIRDLFAVNNVLRIFWDIPYRFNCPSHMFGYLLLFNPNHEWSIPFSDIYREIGAEGDFFGQDIFEEFPLAFNILSKLAGGIGEFINSFYSRDDIISALTAMGIEPG